MTLTIAQASKWLGPKRAEGGDRAPGVDPPARPVRARFRGRPRASPGRRRVSVTPQSQSAPFRHVAAPGRCGATPPARLRGTMENASTGQTRSSNPPPACGAACARVRRSRFGFDLTEKRTLPNRWVQNALFRHDVTAECAFPSRRNRRMRLSVRVPAQNALFRRVRLFSPGQTWRRLTEKRTLPPAPHGKAHSATCASRKGALCNLRLTEKRILRAPRQHQGRAKDVEILESG